MDKSLAFSVEHLSKSFVIPGENRNTFKEYLTHPTRKNRRVTFKALDDISFEVKKGEFFSIIGRNGSGKSTLLKLLAGIYTPDEGIIRVNGEISPFLELGVGFNPELSGKDNIYLNSTILGLSMKEIGQRFKSIVEFAELEPFIQMKLKNYSSGMQVRLAFATAIQSNREILIMDEVLAVGDANFQVKCLNVFEKIIQSGKTIIFVSHDITAVQKYSSRVLYLETGKAGFLGTPDETINKYMFSNILKENPEPEATPDGETPARGQQETALEIKDIRFVNQQNEVTNILTSGQPFHIELDMEVSQELQDLVFNLKIKNEKQEELFTSNSHAESFQTGTLTPGLYTLSYEMPNFFTQGKYFLSGAVSDRTQKLYFDVYHRETSFQVFHNNPLKSNNGIDYPHIIKIQKRESGRHESQ